MSKIMVAAIALLMLSSLLVLAGGEPTEDGDGDSDGDSDGSRATLTVTRFVESKVPVDVNFETSSLNETYHLSVPNSCTVTSASMTINGLERYRLRGSPSGFFDPVGYNHIAYYGQMGVFPPRQSPGNYENIRWDPRSEDMVKVADGTTYDTQTPFGANPPNYPYHHFDLMLNTSGMVRLTVEWRGFGYCSSNDTNTHGVKAFLWNHSGNVWYKFGSYAANDTVGQVRTLTTTLMRPWDFTDRFGHLNLLVFGQHDEAQGGGWTDPGSISSDFVSATVLKNDTLQQPSGPGLAIGPAADFWSHEGAFTSSVTLGDGSGFKGALQSYIDTVAPAPGTVPIPFRFTVGRSTFAELRVTDLRVTVREVENQPPMFLGAKDVTMTEDQDLGRAIDLKDHFDDDHQGSDLLYDVEYAENASAVEAVIHPDGHSVNFLTVADDWAGSLEFRFNATDVWGKSATSTPFKVTVEEVNDRPVLVDPGDQFLDEDSPFELNVTAVDPDVPYGDSVTFGDDSDMFDIEPRTGRISFTPVQEDIGEHRVMISVTDSHGLSDTLALLMTVVDLNDAPIIDDPGQLEVLEDGTLDIRLTVFDEDGDTQFTWVLVGGVGSMKIGQYDGRLSWIPGGEHVGVTNVSVLCTDRRGAAGQLNLSILVVNVNDVPVLDPLDPQQLVEGSPFSHTITFADPDLDEDPDESHTLTIEPQLFPVLPGGVVSFTPGNEHVGVHLLTVTLTDGAGATDVLEWELTVANVNEPPTIEEVEEQTWLEGSRVVLVIEAHDPDLGDVLTFSDSTSIFDIDPISGEINFTPQQMNVGKHTLRIVATDPAGLYADVYFDVTIIAFNDPPEVGIRVVTLKEDLEEGDQLSLAADVDDVDNGVGDFTYFWTLDGKEVGNDPTLDLNDLGPGRHRVELRVNDGDNDATASYEFKVSEVEEGFPWTWVVLAVVIAVVAVVGWKAFLAVQDTGSGKGTVKVEPEPKEPEVTEPVVDDTFEGWQGR
jgi:hypothetical protein